MFYLRDFLMLNLIPTPLRLMIEYMTLMMYRCEQLSIFNLTSRWDFSSIFLCYSLISLYHKYMNTLLIISAIALLVWIAGTLLVIRGIEEPQYTIVEKREGYEIREYVSYIIAEVEVEGDMRTAMSAGFRQLAGYIFG